MTQVIEIEEKKKPRFFFPCFAFAWMTSLLEGRAWARPR
jgi:hypothetical protein